MARLSARTRIALLLFLVVGLAAAAHFSGVASWLTRERVAEIAASSGAIGLVLYFGLCALGELLQLPSFVFVVAAVAAYGPWVGTLVAYLGMNVASVAVFLFGRAVAGPALAELAHPRVKALMREIDRAPIRTVFLARGVFFVLPGVGYALALSSVRFREFVLGSALGLVIPSVLGAALGEWALDLLSAH